MIEDPEQAVNEVCRMIQDAWELDGRTQPIPIVWDNVAHDYQGAPDFHGNQLPWLLVTVTNESARKVSLKGTGGGSRFEHQGSIIAALHTPRGKGTVGPLPLISVVGDTFQGKRSPNGVTFHQVQYTNGGNSGAFYVTAMTAEFRYDQIR